MSIEIDRHFDGQVETWWLAREDARNAITFEMWSDLAEHAQRVRADSTVRVVVVRGRGDHFSAGADITGLGRRLAADHDGSNYRATNAAAEAAIAALPLPTVAAIDGFCVGGGVQLALACDLRVATNSARFAVTPAKLGIAYPAGAIRRLLATVGVAMTNELLLTGETIDASTALRVGLVNRVVDDLDESIDTLVATLLERSPFTQAATKVVTGLIIDHVDLGEMSDRLERASLEHDDLAEGLSAFAEKRPPRFVDRPDLD